MPRRAQYGSTTSLSTKAQQPPAGAGADGGVTSEATGLLSSGGGGARVQEQQKQTVGRSVGFSDTVELASFEHLLEQEIDKVRQMLLLLLLLLL